MWDHPRVCGEQLMVRIFGDASAGSPPRVRGTGPLLCVQVIADGITPACAGNSTKNVAALSIREDHPRVCGEQEKS